MTAYLVSATYLVGAVIILSVLLFVCVFCVLALRHGATYLFKAALRIRNITMLLYWLRRMEAEGLIVVSKGYKDMVAARNPKSIADYESIEQETISQGASK